MEADSRPGPSHRPLPVAPPRGVKRNHAQMRDAHRPQMNRAGSPLFVESHDSSTPEAQTPRIILPPLEPRIRTGVPNDRLPAVPREVTVLRRTVDLRRPAMSPLRTPEVIDLTSSAEEADVGASTLSDRHTAGTIRFGGSRPTGRLTTDHTAAGPFLPPRLRREQSLDVMVIGERRAQHAPAHVVHDLTQETDVQVDPEGGRAHALRVPEDDGGDVDDDVIFTGIAHVAGVNNAPPSAPVNREPATAPVPPYQELMRFFVSRAPDLVGPMREVAQDIYRAAQNYARGPSAAPTADTPPRQGWTRLETRRRPPFGMPPSRMNYDQLGFEFGVPHIPVRPFQREPTPYAPPEAPPPGFTRSPAEDEEIVCPACGDELGMGPTEDKRQVWTVKACGHVYCGHCMKNRSKSGKRGKSKATGLGTGEASPKTFTHCVVPDCGKKVSSKTAVLQVFL